jgi:hypothetical protein
VVFACFRVLPSRIPRKPIACFPPVRPWVVPGPSGLRFLEAPTAFFQSSRASPLLHFDATLASCSCACHVPPRPMSTMIRKGAYLAQALRPYSISGIRSPSFHSRVRRKRRESFALLPRSLILGFGYPLDEMTWLPKPWGSLSNPNAPGLRSSEPCSSRVIEGPSRIPLSAPALSGKTLTTLPRRSNGLLPPRKPCPFVPPE